MELTRTRGVLVSSSAAMGSRLILSEEVDCAFGMPVGKLRGRAGYSLD
jgi:hypothetical protein